MTFLSLVPIPSRKSGFSFIHGSIAKFGYIYLEIVYWGLVGFIDVSRIRGLSPNGTSLAIVKKTIFFASSGESELTRVPSKTSKMRSRKPEGRAVVSVSTFDYISEKPVQWRCVTILPFRTGSTFLDVLSRMEGDLLPYTA